MNARANLITAMLTLALIVPAAASAGSRNIPADASLPLSKQAIPHRQILKANPSAIRLGAYSNWAAYVHGGSSHKVAKAITAAANTRTTNVCANNAQRPVPC